MVGVALVGLAGSAVYYFVRMKSVPSLTEARRELHQMQDENGMLSRQLKASQGENKKLMDLLAYARQSTRIDSEACTLVKKSLAGQQQEDSNLREQLAFYRGIASPQQSSEGLRVYDLKISPQLQAAGSYNFELLLIQPMHHNHPVKGRAKLAVTGLQDGKARTYRFARLLVGGRKSLLFSFKYFQELDGSIQLPKGFRPLRVTVTLQQADRKPRVDESFDWSKVEQPQGVK